MTYQFKVGDCVRFKDELVNGLYGQSSYIIEHIETADSLHAEEDTRQLVRLANVDPLYRWGWAFEPAIRPGYAMSRLESQEVF